MSRPPSQSFLLRLWREQAETPLRATLISVAQPEEPRHFATLEALHASLAGQEHPPAGEHREQLDCTRSRAG